VKTLLEICAGSLSSALVAEEGGADRIELCSALPLDGLTPSHVAIEMAKKMLKIPVYVLIRPREGNFVYSPLEVALICADIRIAKYLGADGIVCGALDRDGNIDLRAMESFLEVSKGVSFTFHRAFDVCRDPFVAFRQLIDLGVDTLLTSGQAATAQAGAGLIKSLIALAQEDENWDKDEDGGGHGNGDTDKDGGGGHGNGDADKDGDGGHGNGDADKDGGGHDNRYAAITVMPGSGINATNIAAIAMETGAKAIHLSARKRMDGGFDQTDVNEVRACREALDALIR